MKWRRASSYRDTWRARTIADIVKGGREREAADSARPAPGLQSHLPFHRRAAGWMRAHKVYTALLLLLFIILGELASIPWFGVAALKTENPVLTALMRQRIAEAKAAGTPYRITQKWIPLSRIPKSVVDAVVVAEDGTFFTNGGIDWFEVRESIAKDIQERRAARGASTITQQLAKNLFLSTSKDPVRKLKELAITLLLERELGKDRILEIYLNIVEWGQGIFGVEAASEAYFGRRAEDLTLDQAARLAAVIPSPLRHRPDGEGRYVVRRTGIVLQRMEARNMIAAPAGADSTPSAGDSLRAGKGVDTAPADEDTTEFDEGGAHGL